MKSDIGAFTEVVLARFGYDFRNYRAGALHSRLQQLCATLELRGIAELTDWLLRNPDSIGFVVDRICVPVSSLFREPETFAQIRQHVAPGLSSVPYITIWHAGCAAGQEVYSLAILLHEAGLLDRCTIFATDISAEVLGLAAKGQLLREEVAEAQARYRLSGGTSSLDAYFSAKGGMAQFDPALMKNMHFMQYNLASGAVFCEANLILCCNVLIYFNRELQAEVLGLLSNSLARGGYMCLGQRETPSAANGFFRREPGHERIYRSNGRARLQVGLSEGGPHLHGSGAASRQLQDGRTES